MRIVVRKGGKPKRSKLEQKFSEAWWHPFGAKIPYETEYRFHLTRKWQFDFAWPAVKVAVEIQGGIYRRGKHSRGDRQEDDYEKLNEAQALGWVVLQFGPSVLATRKKREEVVRYVTKILTERTNAYQSPNSSVPLSRTVSKVPKRRT